MVAQQFYKYFCWTCESRVSFNPVGRRCSICKPLWRATEGAHQSPVYPKNADTRFHRDLVILCKPQYSVHYSMI